MSLVVTQKTIWSTGNARKPALGSTLQLYNDGAGRRVSARLESCSLPQSELLLADLLACPSRDLGAFDPRGSNDFSASGSSKLLILMWHEVLLYPAGVPTNQITFHPALRLPPGWKFNSSLPVSSQAGNTVDFAPVPLDLLIDSPVQSGEFTKVIPLTPGDALSHELDVVADDAWALEIPPALIDGYKKLVAEAGALYQSHQRSRAHAGRSQQAFARGRTFSARVHAFMEWTIPAS